MQPPTRLDRFLEAFARFVLRMRLPIILLTVAGIVGAAHFIKQLKSDNSYNIWYKPGNPHLQTYYRFLDQFGGEEQFIVMIHHPDLFHPDRLRLVERLEQVFRRDPAIIETLSLRSIETFDSVEDNIIARPLIPAVPEDPAALAALKADVLANPFYRGQIINEEGTATVLTATLRQTDMETKTGIVRRLAQALREEIRTATGLPWVYDWPPPWMAPWVSRFDPLTGGYLGRLVQHFRDPTPDFRYEFPDGTRLVFSGQPVLDVEFNRLSLRDGETFFPLVLIAASLTLYLLFRRAAPVFFAFLVVMSAMSITLGLYVMNGNTLNMITTLLPALFTAIGVAEAVHIITQYNEEIADGVPRRQAVHRTIVKMLPPCFFTSFTDCVGFISFASSDILPNQRLGYYAGIGIMLCFLLSIMTVPALLSYLPPPKRRAARHLEKGLASRMVAFLCAYVIRRKTRVLWVSAGLAVVAAVGIARVRIETQVILFLKESNPVRSALTEIQDEIGGVINTEILLTGPKDVFKDPEILRKIQELQRSAEGRFQNQKTISVTDYLKELHKIVASSGPEEYDRNRILPQSPDKVAQLMLLMEASGGEEVYRYVDSDFATARISGRAGFMSSEQAARNIHGQEALMKDLFAGTPVEGVITGLVKLFVMMDETLLRTQLVSFGFSFVFITLAMVALMRSWKIGLLGMVPNLLPIAMMLGVMGYAGFTLDVATTMIASIALGITVDDTIHLLVRLREEFRRHGHYEIALRRAYKGVGNAIVSTSAILFVGFGVLVFGSFLPTTYFGFLASLTMLLAIFGDLMVLPALIVWLKPFGPEHAPLAPEGREG